MVSITKGRVSGSHSLLRGPRLSLTHKQSKHAGVQVVYMRWLNGQQLGFRPSIRRRKRPLSCNLETKPFHRPHHLNKKFALPSSSRRNLLPPTYRNLVVLRSSSASSSSPASFLFSYLRLSFRSIPPALFGHSELVLTVYTGWSWGNEVGLSILVSNPIFQKYLDSLIGSLGRAF